MDAASGILPTRQPAQARSSRTATTELTEPLTFGPGSRAAADPVPGVEEQKQRKGAESADGGRSGEPQQRQVNRSGGGPAADRTGDRGAQKGFKAAQRKRRDIRAVHRQERERSVRSRAAIRQKRKWPAAQRASLSSASLHHIPAIRSTTERRQSAIRRAASWSCRCSRWCALIAKASRPRSDRGSSPWLPGCESGGGRLDSSTEGSALQRISAREKEGRV